MESRASRLPSKHHPDSTIPCSTWLSDLCRLCLLHSSVTHVYAILYKFTLNTGCLAISLQDSWKLGKRIMQTSVSWLPHATVAKCAVPSGHPSSTVLISLQHYVFWEHRHIFGGTFKIPMQPLPLSPSSFLKAGPKDWPLSALAYGLNFRLSMVPGYLLDSK